jgi:hypothetical protein
MKLIKRVPCSFSQAMKQLAKNNNLVNFTEQTNHDLINGAALAFVEGSETLVIVKPIIRKGKLGMLIWSAISQGKNGIETYLPTFLKIAKATNTEFIEFQSKRPGFKRLAKKIQFTQAHSSNGFFVYRREV